MKKSILVKAVDRYGRQIKAVTCNSSKEAEKLEEYYKRHFFDDVQVLVIDQTKYSK